MKRRLIPLITGVVLLGTSALAFPVSQVAADDEFGAFLYSTSCDKLDRGKIIDDVGELESEGERSGEWRRLGSGADFPSRFYAETEDIDRTKISDLTATPHAIAVHAHDSRRADVIACGDITGTEQDGTLMIQLNAANNSGFEGRAFFEPERIGRDLNVTTGIWPSGSVPTLGTPEATPAA